MGVEFINRVIKTSLVVAALGFLFVAVYYRFDFGAGILAGTIWGCLNLLFLTHLITEIFSPGKEVRKGKVIIIALVKFPLLYAAGYLPRRRKWLQQIRSGIKSREGLELSSQDTKQKNRFKVSFLIALLKG